MNVIFCLSVLHPSSIPRSEHNVPATGPGAERVCLTGRSAGKKAKQFPSLSASV